MSPGSGRETEETRPSADARGEGRAPTTEGVATCGELHKRGKGGTEATPPDPGALVVKALPHVLVTVAVHGCMHRVPPYYEIDAYTSFVDAETGDFAYLSKTADSKSGWNRPELIACASCGLAHRRGSSFFNSSWIMLDDKAAVIAK